MSRRCPHTLPELQMLGYVCQHCASRGARENQGDRLPEDPGAPRTEPAPGFGRAVPPGVRRLCDHLLRLQHQYPDWQFQPPRLNFTPTEAQADHIAAQWEDLVRRAHGQPEMSDASGSLGQQLSQELRGRAERQLAEIRLQQWEERNREQEALVRRLEADAEIQQTVLAEGLVTLQQGQAQLAADRLRLDQRQDCVVLGVAVATLAVTWGPPPTDTARFLFTLLVGCGTWFWFHGRFWMGGNPDAFRSTPAGRGWALLRGLPGRLVGPGARAAGGDPGDR